MTDEEIKNTVLYKDCYEKVKQFPELAGDLVYLLREDNEGYRSNDWDWNHDLDLAFIWRDSPQGHYFWDSIWCGILPKEYE